MKPEDKRYILENMDKMPAGRIAGHLGLKERKVKKIIRLEKEKKGTVRAAAQPRDKKASYLNILAIAFLCILGFIIYSNTLHSSFHFDDVTGIVSNVNNIKNLYNINTVLSLFPTRCITYLSIFVNYHFNRLDVFGYHIFNLIVHLCSSIMVWWLVLLTLRTPVFKDKKIAAHSNIIAFFAALLFISHPIQTQGVTYIIQRTASLATLFYVSSLVFYVKSRLLKHEANKPLIRAFYYILSFVALILGMFTKEITITLPLMILLYEFCFFKEEGGIDWKLIAPFLVTMLIIPVTMALTKSVNFGEMKLSMQESPGISPWNYLLTQFRVLITYIRLLFVPINQNLDYDYVISRSLFNIPVLSSIVLLGLILFSAIKAFRKYRLVSFGIFFFFLTLLPESSIIPIKDIIFEHRLYLPMIGFSIFLVSAIYYIFENKGIVPAVTILSIITVACSILTYNRNFVWKDEFTLWDDVVRKSPNNARAHYNRGNAYIQQGDLPKALSDYTKAVEIDPGYADAYNNRGNIYHKQGSFAQAISDYTKAIEIKPNYAAAYNNRGNTCSQQGSFAQAISDYTKAIEINPDYADAYYNRGYVYVQQGNFTQAIPDYTRAIEINPNYAQAYSNRGNAYYQQGDSVKAISDYTRAIEINPNHAGAYSNRGSAYYQQGNCAQAISDYSRAIAIDPKYSDAYLNRAAAYLKNKEYANSRQDVRSAQALGREVNPGLIEELEKSEKQTVQMSSPGETIETGR